MNNKELEWAMTHEADWPKIARHELALVEMNGKHEGKQFSEIETAQYAILSEYRLVEGR